MNTELKARWIAALRSGEYRQTDGRLHDNGAYCCLGVLVEVDGKYRPDGFTLSDIDDSLEHFGIDETQESKLVDLNDDSRLSFPEIADYIEANL